MQSIGQRLEEARNRKGISLREAAEATKIRSDFLGYFEQDKFDYDLPEIYRRGFLKNYARYLQLDPEKIIIDYDAQQLGKSRAGAKGGAELFGQIEIKSSADESKAPDEGETESSRYGRISRRPAESDNADEAEDEASNEKAFYLKIGLVFVGTLALVFIVFGLIKAILSSSGTTELQPTLSEGATPAAISQTAGSTAAGSSTQNASANQDQISLIASGTVYVLVKQKEDNTVLYRETMSAGETVQLSKSGPVDILFTAGENIVIEHSGERLRPSSSGTAKISIP